MAKQVNTRSQEQIEFIVRVWSSDFKDRAPKSRNYLYDYIKSKHHDFTCGSDVLRDAQKILKDAVKNSKGNFDSISPIQILQNTAYRFAMELRDQFITEAVQLRQNEISDLKSEIHLLKQEIEFLKSMKQHYETQCSLKDMEISNLLEELEAQKEAAAGKGADNESSSTNALEEDLDQSTSTVLVTETMEGAKEDLEAINKAKKAKTHKSKQPKVKAKKIVKVQVDSEDTNENLSPQASEHEVKTLCPDEALVSDLSLLVEDIDQL